ncbi:MAG: bifunctional oligoribonuclease/PAP phosphatase NrnA [Clostridia bacterium]|nr:bifunctional oligoribonuclease/PAP phosphatase NrnA [Clostridia bacterium]
MNLTDVARFLRERDCFTILLHAYPDGDTIGSGYALCYALRKLGKKANVVCAHPIPRSYFFITDSYEPMEFTTQTVVAADVASPKLLGALAEQYPSVDLCIDHHGTNTHYAQHSFIDADAASNAENILAVIEAMDLPIDTYIATCIYTGISTDTGCFKHSNTTPRCHVVAAMLMEAGADVELINQYMFDTKSRERIAIEKSILDSLEFYADGKIAFITVTKAMRDAAGIAEGELEGITSIPRQVEGVAIGCTIRETDKGDYKVSVRSRSTINAADICALFGGGGHPCAAGCNFACNLTDLKQQLSAACLHALECEQ